MSWKTSVIGFCPWEKPDDYQSNGKRHPGHVCYSALQTQGHCLHQHTLPVDFLLFYICWSGFYPDLCILWKTEECLPSQTFRKSTRCPGVNWWKDSTLNLGSIKKLNTTIKFSCLYMIMKIWLTKCLQT